MNGQPLFNSIGPGQVIIVLASSWADGESTLKLVPERDL